ncbi:reverse transcriptase [Gossypium australe]|uniref:Reverse transcriptase n=1 Tax=Gossypium australe TaxID=47621 RepID=A0A5B6WSV6_9ROSI|nr:reverse transcriptase [Gossypium australe]
MRELFQYFHASLTSGHSRIHATRQRFSSMFYWKGLSKNVKTWVRECPICQRPTSTGLLHPLPIPDRAWPAISMDFIESLPQSKGNNTILMVVGRLTKYGHFLTLSHPYTATHMAYTATHMAH